MKINRRKFLGSLFGIGGIIGLSSTSSAKNGDEIFRVSRGGGMVKVDSSDERIYFTDYDGGQDLFCYDMEGNELWSKTISDTSDGPEAIEDIGVYENMVIIAREGYDGHGLYFLSKDDGSTISKHHPGRIFDSLLIENSTVFLGDSSGGLVSYDIPSESTNFSRTAYEREVDVLYKRNNILILLNKEVLDPDFLMGYDLDSDSMVWENEIPNSEYSYERSVGKNGDSFYIAATDLGSDALLFEYDVKSGDILWECTASTGPTIYNLSVLDEKLLFNTRYGNSIMIYDTNKKESEETISIDASGVSDFDYKNGIGALTYHESGESLTLTIEYEIEKLDMLYNPETLVVNKIQGTEQGSEVTGHRHQPE